MISIGEILGKNTYQSQIASDEWKSFSSLIRSHRNFCECCRQGNKTLQVHHLFYEPGRKLWEYSDGEVLVLCRECHQQLHDELKIFRKVVFRRLSPRMFHLVNGALLEGLSTCDPLTFCHAFAEFAKNKRLIENHARVFTDKTAQDQHIDLSQVTDYSTT